MEIGKINGTHGEAFTAEINAAYHCLRSKWELGAAAPQICTWTWEWRASQSQSKELHFNALQSFFLICLCVYTPNGHSGSLLSNNSHACRAFSAYRCQFRGLDTALLSCFLRKRNSDVYFVSFAPSWMATTWPGCEISRAVPICSWEAY